MTDFIAVAILGFLAGAMFTIGLWIWSAEREEGE